MNENNNQMPGMPGMPGMPSTPVAPVQAPVAPVAPVQAAELTTPSHEEEKIIAPVAEVQNVTISDSLEIPFPKEGIEVVASRKGFYNQVRVKPGEKFTVFKFESLGLWMKCTDSDWEKKRVEALKDKRTSR